MTITQSSTALSRPTWLISLLVADQLLVRIVPPTEGVQPIFTVSEDEGILEVCVQLFSQTGITLLSTPVTVTLSTADGNATSMTQRHNYCMAAKLS